MHPRRGERRARRPYCYGWPGDDSPIMRQIGIDVLPAWRGAGIASVLVRDAARLTLAEGYLPFYGTSPSHMLSQRVAMNAGLVPTWWEYVSTSLNDLPMD